MSEIILIWFSSRALWYKTSVWSREIFLHLTKNARWMGEEGGGISSPDQKHKVDGGRHFWSESFQTLWCFFFLLGFTCWVFKALAHFEGQKRVRLKWKSCVILCSMWVVEHLLLFLSVLEWNFMVWISVALWLLDFFLVSLAVGRSYYLPLFLLARQPEDPTNNQWI